MAYVYRHIRKDKNQPFYIGIGSDSNYKRANESGNRRNKIWNDIVSKSDYVVDIIFDEITWEEACEKEKEFIALYGRIDITTGTLCNMTDGGDGVYGHRHTDESKSKIAKSLTGSKRKPLSNELKAKISKAVKGFKHTDEVRRIISECYKGDKNPSAKLVLNMETGIYYECGKYAAQAHGINVGTFRCMLSGNDRNRTQCKYV
jgi:hypothetical protein